MQKEYEKYLNDLPEQVQTAIANANVQQKLRELAKNYKLHLDKWSLLENEIMLTLVGVKDAGGMPSNISRATGVDIATAQVMTDDIAIHIFRPIREALQREVEQKEERAKEILIGKEDTQQEQTPQGYHNTNLKSSERKDIESDPYRESIE